MALPPHDHSAECQRCELLREMEGEILSTLRQSLKRLAEIERRTEFAHWVLKTAIYILMGMVIGRFVAVYLLGARWFF